jgi:hypothetical protein
MATASRFYQHQTARRSSAWDATPARAGHADRWLLALVALALALAAWRTVAPALAVAGTSPMAALHAADSAAAAAAK